MVNVLTRTHEKNNILKQDNRLVSLTVTSDTPVTIENEVNPKIAYRTKSHTSLSKPLCLYVNNQDLSD